MKTNKSIKKRLGRVILIILLIVFIVRLFLVDSFSVSTTNMENTLVDGDIVLVNQTAYGIRMPITPLTVPFTFDSFFGKQSYSDAVQLLYKRIFESQIRRNDVVLFNNPSERKKPLDKRSLLFSRCVGLPTDTIEYANNSLIINGEEYIPSPNQVNTYLKEDSTTVELSSYQSYIRNRDVSLVDDNLTYRLLVPHVGFTIDLTPENVLTYGACIINEIPTIRMEDDSILMLNNRVLKSYTFTEDYYWLLSDNIPNSTDSRQLGFIPFSHIIGQVSYIWWASGKRTEWFERGLVNEK